MALLDKKIGKKIKHLRKALGLSQIDLAERVGVSFQQIQKYEKGASKISVFRLTQLADALGISLHDFLEAEPPVLKVFSPSVKYMPAETSLLPSSGLSPEEITLLKLFRKIRNKKLREGILKQLKGLIELTTKP